MEWQRARPANHKRTLWWTLNDSTRAISRGERNQHTNERTSERTNPKSAAASVPFRNNLRFFFLSLSFSFLFKRDVFVVCDKCIATGARDRLEYNTRARPDGSFAPAMDGRDPASEGEDEVQVVWHHDAAVIMRQLEVFVGPLYVYMCV